MPLRWVKNILNSWFSFFISIHFDAPEIADFFMKRRDPKINYRIQTLFLQGKNISFIAKEIGMSERQIRWRIQNLKKFGSMEPRPIPGRPRKTTEKTDFLILYQALTDKYASAENIRKTMPEPNVSKSTILRRLQEGKKLGSLKSHSSISVIRERDLNGLRNIRTGQLTTGIEFFGPMKQFFSNGVIEG